MMVSAMIWQGGCNMWCFMCELWNLETSSSICLLSHHKVTVSFTLFLLLSYNCLVWYFHVASFLKKKIYWNTYFNLCLKSLLLLLLLLLSRFSRVRLCNPRDGSPPGSPVPGIPSSPVTEIPLISQYIDQIQLPPGNLFRSSWELIIYVLPAGHLLSHVNVSTKLYIVSSPTY